eukprot:TRINITY_DN5334_c0_g2_i10.p2 TRINITY_DN5334_c0_g2~~TRINITY_DN5334_c0_g2_i10.p2  ORF type:complete len:575 (+),score=145.60 TRINITY_DN5334_c0_g2_i10:2547-4271(+)
MHPPVMSQPRSISTGRVFAPMRNPSPMMIPSRTVTVSPSVTQVPRYLSASSIPTAPASIVTSVPASQPLAEFSSFLPTPPLVEEPAKSREFKIPPKPSLVSSEPTDSTPVQPILLDAMTDVEDLPKPPLPPSPVVSHVATNSEPQSFIDYPEVRMLIADAVQAHTEPLLHRIAELTEREQANAANSRSTIDSLNKKLGMANDQVSQLTVKLDDAQQKYLKLFDSHQTMRGQIAMMAKGFDECVKRHAEELQLRDQAIASLQIEIENLRDEVQARESEIEDMKLRFEYAPTLSKSYLRDSVVSAEEPPKSNTQSAEPREHSQLKLEDLALAPRSLLPEKQSSQSGDEINKTPAKQEEEENNTSLDTSDQLPRKDEASGDDRADEDTRSNSSELTPGKPIHRVPTERLVVKSKFTYIPNTLALPEFDTCAAHVKEMFTVIRSFEERKIDSIELCRQLRQLGLKSKGLYEKLCEEIKRLNAEIHKQELSFQALEQKEKSCSEQLIQARVEIRALRQEKKTQEAEKRELQSYCSELEFELKRFQATSKEETPPRQKQLRRPKSKLLSPEESPVNKSGA